MKWKLILDSSIFVFMIVLGSYIGCELALRIGGSRTVGMVTIEVPAEQRCIREEK